VRVDWTLTAPQGEGQAGVFHCCRHRLFRVGPLLTFYTGARPAWLAVSFRKSGRPYVRRCGRARVDVTPPCSGMAAAS